MDTTNSNNKSGTNYLLAIGIDQYTALPRLYNAVKDAREFVSVLLGRYQFSSDHTSELYNELATKSNIINAFKTLAQTVKEEDNVIVYFSGHGEYESIFNEGYWMPVNAEVENISRAIPNSLIKTMLGAMNCHHLFVIVDSCFSGTLFNRGSGRVVTRMEVHPSRWGLTSGRNEIVMDGEAGANSPFAESVLYLLKNASGPVGVAELCNKVVEVTSSNASQTPLGEPLNVPGHKGGQMVFHPKRTELMDWQTTQATNTIEAYQTFLRKYPNDEYSAAAQLQINKLELDRAWTKITEMPEDQLLDIRQKILSINDYIQKYNKSKHYRTALKIGEHLEYKRDFIAAQNSVFKLRQFAIRPTPYQKKAEQLIAQMEQNTPSGNVSSVPSPSTQKVKISNSPVSKLNPTYEARPPQEKKSLLKTHFPKGIVALILILIGVYFYLPQETAPASPEQPPISIVFDKETSKTLLHFNDCTPPFKIKVRLVGQPTERFSHDSKATLDISNHFTSAGEYVIIVEDAEEKRYWSQYIYPQPQN